MWLCQGKDGDVQDKSFAHMGLNYDDDESTPLWRYIHEGRWGLVKQEIKMKPCQAQIWMYRTQSDDRSKLRWRLLPLHACLIFKCPDSIIKDIIEAYPEACSMEDDQNQLPIHLASKKHNACDNCDLLLMLVDAYPDGLAIKGKRGMFPRDILQDNINRLTFSLATVDPERRMKSNETENELVDSKGTKSSDEADSESIDPEVRVHSKEADSEQTVDGEASNNKENKRVEVDYDLKEALPLYDCIRTKQWVKVKEMVTETPQQARTWILRTEAIDDSKKQRRFLPLHAAIMFNCPRAVLETIVTAYPDGVKQHDDQDRLPIHIAIKHHATYGDRVFSMLVDAYPESVGEMDELGMTPHDLLQDSISMMKISVGILSVPTTNQIPTSMSETKIITQHANAKEEVHETKRDSGIATDDFVLENPPTNMKEVDYDSASNTALFKSIQSLQWSRVKETVAQDPQQTQIWTYRMEEGSAKKLRWKMLPLHACIIFKCPNWVLKIVTEAFPEASLMKDDQGYVPLQLARKKHNAYDDYDDDALDLLVEAMRSVAVQTTCSDPSEVDMDDQDESQRKLSPTALMDHKCSVLNAAEKARMSSILQEEDDTVVLMDEGHDELVEEGEINCDDEDDSLSSEHYTDIDSIPYSERSRNSMKSQIDPLSNENTARHEPHDDSALKTGRDTVNGKIPVGRAHVISAAAEKSQSKYSHVNNCNEISPTSVCDPVYGTERAHFAYLKSDVEKGEDIPQQPSKMLLRSFEGNNETCCDLIEKKHKPSTYVEDTQKADLSSKSVNDQQSSLSNPSEYEDDLMAGESVVRNDDYVSDTSYDDSEDESSYVEALNQWIRYSNQREGGGGRNSDGNVTATKTTFIDL